MLHISRVTGIHKATTAGHHLVFNHTVARLLTLQHMQQCACTCIHIYIHTHIYIYVHIYVCVCCTLLCTYHVQYAYIYTQKTFSMGKPWAFHMLAYRRAFNKGQSSFCQGTMCSSSWLSLASMSSNFSESSQDLSPYSLQQFSCGFLEWTKSQGAIPGLVMTFTVHHGFSMVLIEIDGLPNLIAWWIFPWLC